MKDTERPYLVMLAFLFGLLDILLLLLFEAAGDWSPLWAGARVALSDPARIYDFALIEEMQAPMFGEVGEHPFIYPPSALLFFIPFALLPLTASWLAFVAASAALFAIASAKIGASRLVLVAPPVVLAAVVGQTTLMIAALGFAALILLPRAPVKAGILFALAASIKPTLLILAPVALLAAGQYRALAAAGFAGLIVIALSLLCFGLAPWLAWVAALPDFQAVFLANQSLVRTAVTPFALAARYDLHLPLLLPTCAIIAVSAVILVFRRSDSVAARSAALFGGALLVSPYAMNYELALLAPAVMTIKLRRMRHLVVPLTYAASLFATASLAGLAVIFAWFVGRVWWSARNEPGVKRGIDVAARQHHHCAGPRLDLAG